MVFEVLDLGRKINLTKQRILEAAKLAFSKKGYEGVSIDEIAQLANVRKSLIYYYFPSKEVLFEEVWVNSINELENELFGENENESNYAVKIKNFLRRYIDFLTSKKAISELIRREKTNILDHETWKNAKKRYESFLSKIEEMISEGKKKKYVNENIEPEVATEMIASVDSVPRKTLLRQIEKMLVNVLLKER
ncbi:transcriptional regulator, TetR family [Thermosipho atlanticus DSM 15807]|uniref:Transcriptional regulator, TetR family n=1 Tax=Thermosipho atlanticus DSM 15807 TaxID=1123380 RepID=A0A1M5QSY7_9BACT|nr:transcriptional regulator, TetR family [Thermosipho atlanticus DSM 15807]